MQNNEFILTNPNAPLIKVEQQGDAQIVSARDLYSFLEVKTDFTDWCKRMFEYGFIENQDFNFLKFEEVRFEGKRQVKRDVIDYALTLDCAKEIAMLQRSDKGKQARQYFIECEKQLNKPKSMAEISLMHAQMLVNIEREQQAQAEKIKMIEAKVSSINTEYFSLSGYFVFMHKKWNLSNEEAQKIGKALKILSLSKNFEILKVHDSKYGQVNTYHIEILNLYFGKKH